MPESTPENPCVSGHPAESPAGSVTIPADRVPTTSPAARIDRPGLTRSERLLIPAVPDWGLSSEEVTFMMASPGTTPPPVRWLATAPTREELSDLLTTETAHETFTQILVHSALDWTRPDHGSWWQAGLRIAEEHPNLGHRMLAHALGMLDVAWHQEDDLHWEHHESMAWACLLDPDEDLGRGEVRTLADYIQYQDDHDAQVIDLHHDYLDWLKVAVKLTSARALGKLTAIRATGYPTVDPGELISALSTLAREVAPDHLATEDDE